MGRNAGAGRFSLAGISGAIPERRLEHLVSSDRGVIMMRRIWHKAMEDVAGGKDPKGVDRKQNGMLEVDTFHGHVKAHELKIGPENMAYSRDGTRAHSR